MAMIGRILLSLIFILSAVGKIFTWNETVHYLSRSLSEWHGHVASFPWMISLLDRTMELLPFVLAVAVVFEGLGGLMVLFGIQARLGTVLLILFLIPTTILMHPFWLASGEEFEMLRTMFMKNISILGGLFIYLAYLNGGQKTSKSNG